LTILFHCPRGAAILRPIHELEPKVRTVVSVAIATTA